MGLDMYLYLEKYESCGTWHKDYEEKAVGFYPAELKKFGEDISKINFMSKQCQYQVGYWRKANAIHNWIISHCAHGDDNCRMVCICQDDAFALLNDCKAVYRDHSLAPKLLPTQDGFFFGSTEYDEDYFYDIEYTAELLQAVLGFLETKEGKNYDIAYEASW